MHISSRASAANEAADPRIAAMHSTMDTWLTALSDEIAGGGPNTRFREWLAAASRFPAQSARNVVLLTEQAPQATHVEPARTWRAEYGRVVDAAAEPIWLWTPTLAAECTACGELRAGHAEAACDGEASWVATEAGHRPMAVFDDPESDRLTVAVKGGTDVVWMASAVIGELADLLIAAAVDGTDDLHHRSVINPAVALEAAVVRGIVTLYLDLQLTAPRLDLEAWRGNDPAVLSERLARISRTAGQLIDVVTQQSPAP